MATIDDEIEEKKEAVRKAEMRYQEALRGGYGAAQAGLELETLRNDLSSLEKQKQNPQPQAQPKKERKPSKLEQAAMASQSSRQLGNEANANQIIQKHLDSSTYFGKSQEKPRTREDILKDLNEARAKGDVNKIKELEAELRGSPINVNTGSSDTGEADQPTGTPAAPQNTQGSQPAQGSQSQTTQQQPAQNQGQIESNYYTQYYGHDIHNNGAIPFQGKKPEDDKNKKDDKGEEEGDDPKDRTGFLKNFSLLGNVLGARNPNNVLFDRRDTMRGLADEATNMAATLGMQGQSWRQEANRNPYSEASRKTTETNRQQIGANVTANSMAGNSQVGLVRMNNPMDINAEEQKRAEARRLADERQEKQRTTEGQARAYLGEAQQLDTQARNYKGDEEESKRLSLGNGTGTSTTEKDETKKTDENTEETPTTEETKTEETQPEPQEDLGEGGKQNILNYLDGSSVRRTTSASNPEVAKGWIVSENANGEITVKEDPRYNRGNPSQYTDIPAYTAEDEKKVRAVAAKHPEYGRQEGETQDQWTDRVNKSWRGGNIGTKEFDKNQGQIQQYACGTKNAKPGYAIVGENGPEIVKMKGGEEVIPNDRAERIISDERMKFIKTCFDLGLGIIPEDFEWLAKKQGGKYKHNEREYDFFNDDDWADDTDDSVLRGYADHIKNYLYTYIPEAQEIDSSIDPEQEHIGPMAQDIEKVNPACIVETPEGVKTVDTGRLAMMNAGAIGDLARQLRELKEVFING